MGQNIDKYGQTKPNQWNIFKWKHTIWAYDSLTME